jgi:DNA-binding transcriptional LysR family regulator
MITADDLRFVLAVFRAGSTLGASRALNVSQSTVTRRIAAIEHDLALQLFDKGPHGYAATATLHRLLGRIEAVETACTAFCAEADLLRRDVGGKVLLTAPEIIAVQYLHGALVPLRARYPGIEVEVLASDRRMDLASGEADIAIRAGARPAGGALFGRRIAHDRWTLFCSSDYARRNGVPRQAADLASHSFIDFKEGVHSGAMREWLDRHVARDRVVMRHNSFVSILAAVKAGLGISFGSGFIVAIDPELVNCFTPEESETYEVWLLAHERHRKTRRVRLVMEHLGEYFSAAQAASGAADGAGRKQAEPA